MFTRISTALGRRARHARAALSLVAPLALLALTTACADTTAPSPVASAGHAVTASLNASGNGVERIVDVDTFDLTGIEVLVDCNGTYTEPIVLRGQVVAKEVVTFDAAGGVHARLDWMSVGMGGTGTITGADYRMSEREFGVYNSNGMGAGASFRIVTDVRAQSLGFHARLMITAHWVDNANGEPVLEREKIEARCKA